jgi:hypothetical protein
MVAPLKVDRLFDTLEEAKDFLATCQSNIGRASPKRIELDRDEKAKQIAELLASPPCPSISSNTLPSMCQKHQRATT